MAEALGLVASIVPVLQLSGIVIKYLSDVKHAPKECSSLILEISSTTGILGSLEKLVAEQNRETVDPWLPTVRLLGTSGGPLELYRDALERVKELLEPSIKLHKLSGHFVWPFKQKEAQKLLEQIERQHKLFNIALVSDHVRLSKAIKDDLADFGTKIDALQEGINSLQSSYKVQDFQAQSLKREKVLSWLSDLDFTSIQNETLDRRHEGSGRWFLEHPIFQSWLLGNQATLWAPGIPGAGKTVMASIVVDYLETTLTASDAGVAYIYFSYKDQDQTINRLLASLLQQLARQQATLSDSLSDLFDSLATRKSTLAQRHLIQLLKAESERFHHIYIVIDALDECTEKDDTRSHLLRAILNSISDLHLLVTSREIVTIENDLGKPSRLDISANPNDVRGYIHEQCRVSSRLRKHVNEDPDLEAEITTTIMQNLDGMFLYARLYMRSLNSARVKKDVRSLLRNPPRGLDALYDQTLWIINQQEPEDVLLAQRVLSWVAFTTRAFTLTEMQHLLATHMKEGTLSLDAVPSEETLSAVCAGLVRIEDEGVSSVWKEFLPVEKQSYKVMKFVHFTTQHYISQRREGLFDYYNWYSEALKISLHTVRIEYEERPKGYHDVKFEPSNISTYRGLYHARLLYQKSAFADYALVFLTSQPNRRIDVQALGIPNLALDVLNIPSVTQQIMNMAFFLLHERTEPLSRKSYLSDTYEHKPVTDFVKEFSDIPLPHVAASLGFVETLRLSLTPSGPWLIDSKDRNGLTPLSYATIVGASATVKLLLDMGASVEESCSIVSPLDILVSSFGSLAIIEAWLKVPGLPKDVCVSALLKAVWARDTEAITVLIRHCADNFPEERLDSRVLLLAIESGDVKTLQYLLESGLRYVDADAENPTLLFHAVRYNSLLCAEELVKCDIDVNKKNAYGEHALFLAARNGFLDMGSSLVEGGAELDIRSESGFTVRHILLASFFAGDIGFTRGIAPEAADEKPQETILRSQDPFAICHTRYAVADRRRDTLAPEDD